MEETSGKNAKLIVLLFIIIFVVLIFFKTSLKETIIPDTCQFGLEFNCLTFNNTNGTITLTLQNNLPKIVWIYSYDYSTDGLNWQSCNLPSKIPIKSQEQQLFTCVIKEDTFYTKFKLTYTDGKDNPIYAKPIYGELYYAVPTQK